VTQILLPDVDAANTIAMVRPAAFRATKHSAFDLASHITTVRASTARVVLVLQGHVHPQALRLLGELVADRAVRPLMDFLVVRVSNIVVLPDIAHIAYHNCLHAIRVKRGDQSGCALVFDILDLILDLLELFLPRVAQLLATAGTFLHPPIDAAITVGLQFVAVVHFGA